jgi:hypothetical protein
VGIVRFDYCVQTVLAAVMLVLMWWLCRDSDRTEDTD